jgi:CheY-like chemotaxis protein
VDAAETMAFLLRDCGHSVQCAADGVGGLQLARAYRPDVVLLDLGLPDIDGLGVMSALKHMAGLERTKIFVITARSRDGDLDRALNAGCDQFFYKPVPPGILEAVVGEPAAQAESGGGTRH